MQLLDNNKQAFLALSQAGLWESKVRLSQYEPIDFGIIHQLAQEQSVVGLVAAGLESVVDIDIPKEVALGFAGEALQLEQRNTSMNSFIGFLVKRMQGEGIYALLIKGQGIAQCYKRPLWRACGDIDLLLSFDNYQKAVILLRGIAQQVEDENEYFKHLGMTIDKWSVELHGTLRSGLWNGIDREIDKIQSEVLFEGKVRSWKVGETPVFLPSPDEDIIFVFSHILQHFFKEGIGLRQLCDWCRLLWTFHNKIDESLLERRITSMGLMTEWRSFAALAVDYLGMPSEAIPLYSSLEKWKRKAKRVLLFIFRTGNFGNNRDMTYTVKYPCIIRKLITLWKYLCDSFQLFFIFPMDSVKVCTRVLFLSK